MRDGRSEEDGIIEIQITGGGGEGGGGDLLDQKSDLWEENTACLVFLTWASESWVRQVGEPANWIQRLQVDDTSTACSLQLQKTDRKLTGQSNLFSCFRLLLSYYCVFRQPNRQPLAKDSCGLQSSSPSQHPKPEHWRMDLEGRDKSFLRSTRSGCCNVN